MKKNKLFAALLFSLFSLTIAVSCVKDKGKLPVEQTVNECDTITYTKHIKPIITAKCISCHGNPLAGGAPLFLTTYAEVKAVGDNGELKATTIDGAPLMPYGGPALSQEQKNLITCWLNNGKKE